MGQRTND